jgi:hypothetical protein
MLRCKLGGRLVNRKPAVSQAPSQSEMDLNDFPSLQVQPSRGVACRQLLAIENEADPRGLWPSNQPLTRCP